MALQRRSPKAVTVVNRDELRRQEQEIGLFARASKQLLSLDAQPATNAYFKQSHNVDDAAARTTAPPTTGIVGPGLSWTLHGALHARTMLHNAAQNGRAEALEGILDTMAAADAARPVVKKRGGIQVQPVNGLRLCLDARDGHGDSALMLAARGGHLECCRLLLEAGCEPNFASKGSGHTALHAAALVDEREVLEVLVHFESDPTLKTYNGHTPSKLARSKNFLRAAVYLEAAEVEWRRKHPHRSDRLRKLFVDCECSFCSLLRAKGGNRDDPAVATVGAWRQVQPPGLLTERRDPQTAHLILEADRVTRTPKKVEDGDASDAPLCT